MKSKLAVAVLALAAITFTACDETPTATFAGGETAASGARGAANGNAPFPVFHQGFNHGVFPWIDGHPPDAGPAGWCGTVIHVDGRGADPRPSAGRGYATVAMGACNDFWKGQFGDPDAASAPASGPNFELMSTTWPTSGFVQELDVWLDPASYADGLAFIYANSLCVRALGPDDDVCDPQPAAPSPFRYFPVFVAKGGGALHVAGASVGEAGWYTFRHLFGSDGGALSVTFEIEKDDVVLGSEAVVATFLTAEATSSFDVADLGSGYVWFPLLAGPPLPIDEHRLRPGG